MLHKIVFITNENLSKLLSVMSTISLKCYGIIMLIPRYEKNREAFILIILKNVATVLGMNGNKKKTPGELHQCRKD